MVAMEVEVEADAMVVGVMILMHEGMLKLLASVLLVVIGLRTVPELFNVTAILVAPVVIKLIVVLLSSVAGKHTVEEAVVRVLVIVGVGRCVRA